MSVKPVSRSKGRSSTAAAAYRAACKIEDKRTGLEHDYTKKAGVKHTEIITPEGVNIPTRSELWNAAEAAEKRKDGCTAREYEVNLPYELNEKQRTELAQDFCKQLAKIHGIAVDLCIHEPTEREIKAGADARNHHAHILTTTRKITNDGLTDKADIEKAGRKRKDDLKATRELWATTVNEHLKKAGLDERIDARSLKDQGSSLKPTIKLGKVATQMEREPLYTPKGETPRPKYQTRKGDINRAIRADNLQIVNLENEIVDLRQALKQSEIQLPKPSPFSHKKRADKIPDVEISSFAKDMLAGLHKEHDAILEQSNDAVFDERFDDSYQQFFHNVDSFYNLMLKECDKQNQRDKSFADVVESVSAVFELVKNIEDVRVEKDIELSPRATDAQQSFVESHEALASKVEQQTQQTQQQTQRHTRRL